jgi:isopenicillin-N epimerase
LFLLDPNVTYLNFGSFGACPKPIFDDYQKWQRELEREPVQFISVNGFRNLEKSRETLGAYINCDPSNLVYTPNPTFAINIIARNLDLQEGDEILSTDLEYGAMDRTWNYYCRQRKAKYVRQPVLLPLTTREAFLENFWKGYSSRTKAIFISQITSTTALILPVKEICEKAKSLGLMTIVDGAHVPGHVKLDLSEIKADVYTGACHKWMMTPKGSSFLYVRKELHQQLDPLIISWGYESDAPSGSQFLDYHQFNGTRDFTAYLTIPKSIEFMQQYNWTEVGRECRKLVQQNAARFSELLHAAPLCPVTDEFLGQMLSLQIYTDAPEKLQQTLFSDFHIEIPVMKHGNRVTIRFSINAFNSQQDLDRLYDALGEIISAKKLLRQPEMI